MPQYRDTGFDGDQDSGHWLEEHLIEGLKGFRCQFGYFRFGAVRPFADLILRAAQAGHPVRFVLGSNDGSLQAQDVQRVIRVAEGENASVTVVAYENAEYHPKTIHLIKPDDSVVALVGSSNLTRSGFGLNVEASVSLSSFEGDADQISRVAAAVDRWVGAGEELAAYQVRTDADIQSLVDREIINLPQPTRRRSASRGSGSGERLNRRTGSWNPSRAGWLPDIPDLIPAPADEEILPPVEPDAPIAPAVPPAPAAPPPPPPTFHRIWQSGGLTERDLTIPTGSTTHATGSMLWKKGVAQGIDQRHWFRDVAFDGLNWQADPGTPHLHRAFADFEFVIAGIRAGVFNLKLTHNTDTSSRSYEQKNSMTQIHWGPSRPIVANRALLGRTMSLFRQDGNPPTFRIEIA